MSFLSCTVAKLIALVLQQAAMQINYGAQQQTITTEIENGGSVRAPKVNINRMVLL